MSGIIYDTLYTVWLFSGKGDARVLVFCGNGDFLSGRPVCRVYAGGPRYRPQGIKQADEPRVALRVPGA